MKSTLLAMFEYKAWANQLLLASLRELELQLAPQLFQKILAIYDHAQVVDAIFQAHLQARPHSWQDSQSASLPDLEDLSQNLKITDSWYSDFVACLGEAEIQLVRHFHFTDGQPGTMTVQEILWHVISHAAYHRGSIAQLLEDAGYPSPADSLTKFLHYTEPQRRLPASMSGRSD